MRDLDDKYMQRCIQLALLGQGSVAPNPMVGAVLVYEERIIGEGYHREYGHAHAEVNCINNVKEADRHLISQAALYVSLEPCSHFGKTPPCSDLIIKHGIKKVVIGSRDPFPAVNGKGIEKLMAAGIAVKTGVLGKECDDLNTRFFCFHLQQRPWILLKWAQTANGKMAGIGEQRLKISNEYTNRLVHRWRSEEAAILVGTSTALKDDPALDNRLFAGRSPVRMVLDANLRLPSTLQLFDGKNRTIIFNLNRDEKNGNTEYHRLQNDQDMLRQMMAACYTMNMQSIMVEGGAKLLKAFIDADCWDEARVITNSELNIADGLSAPVLNVNPFISTAIFSDKINYYKNDQNK